MTRGFGGSDEPLERILLLWATVKLLLAPSDFFPAPVSALTNKHDNGYYNRGRCGVVNCEFLQVNGF